MSKADVLALVDTFLIKPDTTGEADNFYDEIVRELGFREFLTSTRTLTVLPGIGQYQIALDTVRVLETHTGAQGRLDPQSGRALRAGYGSDWRLQNGSPFFVTRTDESANQLRLFPLPVGLDTLTVIRTDTPEDLPYWLELPVALEITSRMLVRESAARDLEFANQAKRLATILFAMVGLQLRTFASSRDSRDPNNVIEE